ncbi:unnamed protein product [Sphenostylis stenocarpa]|uniref:F-box domain-containing protein n=1 Tax=Sphenostylis stenocarpa TaxID=92480 RepID=A0AA86RL69_9FABA|nr:unnamed protein product [Sphenostylis stenocarpa]
MADRISALPDALISHILSFLPTSVAITTTVLSKRWNSLWCLCPTLSFDDSHYLPDAHDRNYSRFVQSVHIAILSRHCHQTIQSFRLKCRSLLCDSTNVSVWINVVVQRGVQHLDLSFVKMFTLPSSVLTCKTLVVLKLNRFIIKNFSSVDFPMLKIMHLRDLTFLEHRHFVELLSAAPNLEDLEAVDLIFFCRAVQPRFKTLPKLDRAMIAKIDVSLVVLSNAKFLRVDWVMNK